MKKKTSEKKAELREAEARADAEYAKDFARRWKEIPKHLRQLYFDEYPA